MIERMKAIQSREGNPEGVKMDFFGNSVCLYSKTMPWATFNTVKGFSAEDLDFLDAIIDFFRKRERKIQFEIVPSRVNQQVLSVLSERGFYPSGFHTSTYCEPHDQLLQRPDHIEIKELTEEEFHTYAMIHCRGTGLPDNGIPHVAENNKVLWKRPGWKFYLAYVQGQPAATAVMYTADRIASFTFAATLPEFRGQGLHQYLLNTRIVEAFQQNCELAVGQCAFLSQSHRNMERLGMKLGYIKTTWTER